MTDGGLSAAPGAPSERRRVGVLGATGIGMGAMLGAGVFAVWGPAASQAGTALLWALGIAALVAAVNALSTAQLAAFHPVAGGAYTFGRREVHPTAGFVAGIGFVVGKTASIAAIALALGHYAWPDASQAVATAAIAAAWLLNAQGVTRTAGVATAIALGVVLSLAVVVSVALFTDRSAVTGAVAGATPGADAAAPTAGGVLGAAALVFFAFAGYARIATLGEEVKRPQRTIPRAIILALAVVLVVYAAVAVTLLSVLGADAVAGSATPVADLARGTAIPGAAVAAVATAAAFGSLVALMAGVGRTAMAMAREHDLPRMMAHRGASGAPWVAEALCATVALILVWVGDLGFAIAMSSFAVLAYYAVANLAAHRARRRGHVAGMTVWPAVSAVGAALCVVLAFALPLSAVVAAGGLLALAVAAREFARGPRAE